MTVVLAQDDALPDPRQWPGMTKAQRIYLVEHFVLYHDRFNTLLERIDYCARFGSAIESKNPPCLAILGNTGAGKTTLLDVWLEKAPLRTTETSEGTIIPYLYVMVLSSPKKKGAVAAFLRALHDPNPSRGTEWNMIMRVHNLIKRCKVQMIFVDEFQHLRDKDAGRSGRVVHAIADFLKDIINQTHVPMILVGKLGEAEEILEANSQLARRVGTPLVLKPFEWDRRNPDTIKEFRTLMRDIDRGLPLDPSHLDNEEMAFRFFYASDGYLGWVMEIIWEAAIRAIDKDCHCLNMPLLEDAYNARIAGTEIGRGKVNPFSPGKFSEETVDQPKHPPK
jgi:Bacterial TniB protein